MRRDQSGANVPEETVWVTVLGGRRVQAILGRPRGAALSERIDPRHNSINAMRLVLAFAVLLSHSMQLAQGESNAPTGSVVDLSTLAVDGFFALSGYLILGSYLGSRSVRGYLWRRCLRILPGFWVCLVVSALVIGPLTALFAGRLGGYAWTGTDSAVSFMWKNSLLLVRQFEIAGGYGGRPVNGSLHTLFYEFLCYLAVAGAGVAGLYRLRRSRIGVLVLGVWLPVMLGVLALPGLIEGHPARSLLLRYGSMFLFGCAAHLFADRVRMHPLGHVVALAVFTTAVSLSAIVGGSRGLVLYTLLAPAAVAYLVLGLGASTKLARIGSKRDLSYGLYVYAWPVQATLLVLGAADWWLSAFVAASLALSLALAFLSWTWIEAPALRLKTWAPLRRPAAAAIGPVDRDQVGTSSDVRRS